MKILVIVGLGVTSIYRESSEEIYKELPYDSSQLFEACLYIAKKRIAYGEKVFSSDVFIIDGSISTNWDIILFFNNIRTNLRHF